MMNSTHGEHERQQRRLPAEDVRVDDHVERDAHHEVDPDRHDPARVVGEEREDRGQDRRADEDGHARLDAAERRRAHQASCSTRRTCRIAFEVALASESCIASFEWKRRGFGLLGLVAVGDEAPPDVLQPRDRVAVGHDRVGVDPHHAAARVGAVEPGDAAVGLELDPAVLDRHLVELDQAAQERDGERRLVEPGARDDAGDVEVARVLAVPARHVDAEPERPGLDLVDLADDLLEAALLAALLDPLLPAAPRRRRALEDPAEELDALVEAERLERVDAERLEEAARRVQVLLVGDRVADQGDDLRADVERVRPLVHRRDARADHDVAPALVVLLRRVGLDDPVGEHRVLARLGEHRRERQRAVARREHHVLRAPDEVRVLVVEDEVRLAPVHVPALQPADLRRVAVVVPAELVVDDLGLGHDVRHAGVVLPARGAEQRCRAPPRPRLELGEGRPVGREEVRLRLGAEDRLAEVERELLVRLDRVVARPVDRDLLRPEAEVDGGRVDDERAEPVAHDRDRRVPWLRQRHRADPTRSVPNFRQAAWPPADRPTTSGTASRRRAPRAGRRACRDGRAAPAPSRT